jgi:hypothetical protein
MTRSAGRHNGGQLRSRGAISVWELAVVCLLLTGPQTFGNAFAEGRVVIELEEGRDFQGRIRHATVDQHGTAWFSTYRDLLKVERGRAVVVVPGVPNGPLVAVAPGGERYALLDSRRAAYGQFAVELLDLNRPASSLAVLQATEPPFGFGALHVGRSGRILVGVTALDDPEGLKGDFRHTFWSNDGKDQVSAVLEGSRIGILDEQGESILLIGDSDAAAFRNDGTLLWTVNGNFRKGALAQAGETALLNPVGGIDEVHLIRSGSSTQILRMPAPVYDLAITPDGTLGAVAAGAGRIFIIELQSCPGKACRPRQLPALPVIGTHYVTSLRFISGRSLALGVIQAAGAGPFRRFYGGIVLVLATTGALEFQDAIELPEPATWSPSLDVTFGSPVFAAYTPKSVMVVRVEN